MRLLDRVSQSEGVKTWARRVGEITKKLLTRLDAFPVFKLLIPLYVCLAVVFVLLIKHGSVQLLEPAGYIAEIQSQLLWGVIIFAAIVASTMIGSFFFVVFHYRESRRAVYKPEWTASKKVVALGWLILLVPITAISVVLWNTAHMVDPYRTISSSRSSITIQVVALQWKWLFLYPNDHIATVNTLEIPVDTPVTFKLTADAPMNSFWIPRLSGQVYAMTGMVTQLHVRADKLGTYYGNSAEISGAGYAGMDFVVHVVPNDEYAAWKDIVQEPEVATELTYADYQQLAQPSSYVRPAQYRLRDENLFDLIVMQFMVPGTDLSTETIRGAHV